MGKGYPQKETLMNRSKRILILLLAMLTCFGCLAGCSKHDGDGYDIVYDGSYMQKRYAWYLHDCIEKTANVNMRVTKTRPSGNMPYVELCASEDLRDGNFRIEKAENGVVKIYAGDYYGFTGAARYFSDSIAKNGDLSLDPNECADGNYTDYLKSYEGATAYAYDNRSDLRVMFYNVLWGKNDYAYERNALNDAIVGEYLPDVLGLQEMDKSKRGEAIDGKGGLIAMLAERGYAEAIDPCVKNLYGTNESIPDSDNGAVTGTILMENTKNYYDAFNREYMDRKSGTPLKGYGGTEKGIRVVAGGETYYTYFNCTPLLYNTRTTECIEAGYYWYRYQWDQRVCLDCVLCRNGWHDYSNSHHPNSATDAASKSATWGVFRDKETGNYYIVISTHMCTRSNYIKGLQARELIDFINNELLTKYNYPVILGGDYNGKYHEPNYLYFTQDAGYTDVERSNLATDYTSVIRAHHPYPVMDIERFFVVEDKNNTTPSIMNRPDLSVDHILLGNGGKEKLKASVYGIVVDEMSLAGADHYPIFMDFSFKK